MPQYVRSFPPISTASAGEKILYGHLIVDSSEAEAKFVLICYLYQGAQFLCSDLFIFSFSNWYNKKAREGHTSVGYLCFVDMDQKRQR